MQHLTVIELNAGPDKTKLLFANAQQFTFCGFAIAGSSLNEDSSVQKCGIL